jgi:hypothetical protein
VIPHIPRDVPVAQGPAPEPEPDLEGYPKRSLCQHCGDPIELAALGGEWGMGTRHGRSTECAAAPNPDDGPMPGHVPGVVLHPPRR